MYNEQEERRPLTFSTTFVTSLLKTKSYYNKYITTLNKVFNSELQLELWIIY